jgi:hypothetical protein
MSKYMVIDELVASVYAVDLGLTEEQGEKLYARMLENSDWRNKISAEVELAFSDENFSWIDFFDEHDLYTTDSESDARSYAEKIIRAPLRQS